MHLGRIKRLVSIFLCVIMLATLLQVKEASASCSHSWGAWSTVKSANCTTGGLRKRTCSKCKKEETENIAPLGHNSSGTKSTAATCTEDGYNIKYCTRCSNIMERKLSQKALGHNWGDWKTTKSATCTTGGTKQRKCSRCGKTETANIAKLGHNSSGSKSTAATCTEDGYSIKYCTRCSNVMERKVSQKALGHNWEDWKTTKSATCTTGGMKQRKCSRCGKTETSNIAPLGHDSDNKKTVKATCEKDGYTETSCSRCSQVMSRTVIKATGNHTWGAWSTTRNATCTEGGVRTHTCSECGKTVTENIAPLGHNSKGSKTVEATCDKDGYTAKTCTNCGNIMSRTVIPATGNHTWGKWSTAKEPTCTEGGTRKHTCSKCGKTAFENLAPKGHTWGNWAVTKDAKCTENGTKKRSCLTCGVSETESIAAPGHTWGTWNEVKKATCTEGGTRKHSCTKCGTTVSENVAALGHTSTGVKRTVDATCTSDGYTAIICNRCNKEMSKTIIPSPGHVWGEWEPVVPVTCTEDGTRRHSCTACGVTSVEVVKATGHSSTGVKKIVNPTCTKNGYTAIICNNCHGEMSRTIQPATGHKWGEWDIVQDAACEKTGLKNHTCEKCGTTVTEIIPAEEHSYSGQHRVIKKATCEEDGYEAIICNKCGKDVPGGRTLPKTGHKMETVEEITPATCYSTGVGIRHCTNPNCTYSIQTVLEKKNHEPITFDEPATCFRGGQKGTKCKICGEIFGYSTVTPKGDHSYGYWTLYRPLCTDTENAYVRFCVYCGACDDVKYEAKSTSDYYIIFDANGGKGSMATIYLNAPTTPLPDCGFKKDAYVFRCWSESPDPYKGCSYLPGEDYRSVDTPVTLYAIWDPIVYTIRWNYNYPGCPDPIDEGIRYGYETLTREFKRDGYKFVGWKGYTDGGKQLSFPAGKVIKNLTVNDKVTINLYAQWEKQEGTYTVTFNDGLRGVGYINADLGTEIKTLRYYKNGWCCLGWSTSPDGVVDYEVNKKYEFTNDTTLYAVWRQYIVSFDANGGTGAPDSQTVKDGSALKIPTKEPKKTGYDFAGWSYEKTEQTVDFKPGDTFDDCDFVTLYAVWDPIEYTLKLDYGYPRAKEKTIPMPYDFVYYLPNPTRAGYDFVGWKGYTDGGRPLNYSGGTPVSRLSTNKDVTVILMAEWKRDSSYTVVTCIDGSTIVATEAALNGKPIKLPVIYNANSGKKISSWNTNPDGSGMSYEPGKNALFSESTTVYAIYGKYSITYNANGGIGAPDIQYVSYNSTAEISKKEPFRTGYIFRGWSFQKDDTESDFKGGDEYTDYVSIDLYAVWKPVEYTVTFNPGYVGAPKIKSVRGVYGLNDIYMPKLERKGYTLTGWKGYYNGRSLWFPGDYWAKNVADKDNVVIQLTAQWERNEGYCTLSFYSDDKVVISEAVKYGETYKIPSYFETKTGTYCLAWTVKQDGATLQIKDGSKITVTGDMKFYAVWDTYTIRFDPNGTFVTGMPNYITVSKSTPITLPDNIPERPGYVFGGWGTKSPQGDITYHYEPGDPYDVAVEITLYAIWEEKIISPLKGLLQKKYTSVIMKDEYFDREYMSPGWQKINDHAYFIIKTDTSSGSFDTDAFIVYKQDCLICVEEYTDYEGFVKWVHKSLIENNDNEIGARETFMLDFTVDLVKDIIANTSVPGKIAVYSYDTFSLIKEFLDHEDTAVFDTVEYVGLTAASHLDEYVIKFSAKAGVSASSILSAIVNGVKAYCEMKAAENLNLDSLGDRDASLKMFAETIAKKGWSSSVYDAGLRETVNKMYER